jgi:hypothetical protein
VLKITEGVRPFRPAVDARNGLPGMGRCGGGKVYDAAGAGVA